MQMKGIYYVLTRLSVAFGYVLKYPCIAIPIIDTQADL